MQTAYTQDLDHLREIRVFDLHQIARDRWIPVTPSKFVAGNLMMAVGAITRVRLQDVS
jgi:hypothetical protein